MSNPIFLIIQREFLSRVRKKSFILVTLIVPVALAALMFAPGLLASMPEDSKRIIVLDEPSLLLPHEGKEQYAIEYLDPRETNLELAKTSFRDSDYDALLYIPSGSNWDPDFIKNNVLLFGKEDPSMELQGYLDYLLEQQIDKAKLLKNGVDPEIIAQIKTNVTIQSFTLDDEGNDEQSAVPIKMALGYFTGLLIYIFIFFYAVQVMRGVMEEKSSRIVEVIISSVRPYQLMMGKIIGIGLVGVVQFAIWIGLSGIFYTVISTVFFPELFAEHAAAGNAAAKIPGLDVIDMLRSIDFITISIGFLFYFFGGYFLYSALFAAVGSAVDQEADTQQFMLPVTIPMILALTTTVSVVQEPNGTLAFWMSMIPLTSPITMMARLPFGIPLWEVFLSGAILVATFFIVVGLAGKIYRVGILMYGKKVTWKELFKWLKY